MTPEELSAFIDMLTSKGSIKSFKKVQDSVEIEFYPHAPRTLRPGGPMDDDEVAKAALKDALEAAKKEIAEQDADLYYST